MPDPTCRGADVLHDPALHKTTAFTRAEREALGLRGLLPWRVLTQAEQREKALGSLRAQPTDIDKYVFLAGLQDRNERLFYSLLRHHTEELMPIVYTPTVGEACQEFAHIFRRSRGFYVTPEDAGQVRRMLDNWPTDQVRIVVVTDGQRILGLGDLGANGMGIPIGKLALYTTCAGIPPAWCLPIMLDVGTNDEALRNEALYLGWPHARIEGERYDALVEELVVALEDKFPGLLIQFEDFLTPNAYALLGRYRERVLCFNDDVQGTAAVALAGVLAATRAAGTAFRDLRVLFLGAGSAATGIGDLMASALEAEGLTREEALARLWFVDSKGLVVRSRDDLTEHKRPFAQEHAPTDFAGALEAHRPHAMIGSTGSPNTFTEPIVRRLAEWNERPIVFALSNPTSRAECTAEEAYRWSDGRALFASGSPFDPVELDGRVHRPGQGNNAYVFPGIGLGALAVRARTIPDGLFLVAARRLAELVSDDDLAHGRLYPRLADIHSVSTALAVAVAEEAQRQGVATADVGDVAATIAGLQYDPTY